MSIEDAALNPARRPSHPADKAGRILLWLASIAQGLGAELLRGRNEELRDELGKLLEAARMMAIDAYHLGAVHGAAGLDLLPDDDVCEAAGEWHARRAAAAAAHVDEHQDDDPDRGRGGERDELGDHQDGTGAWWHGPTCVRIANCQRHASVVHSGRLDDCQLCPNVEHRADELAAMRAAAELADVDDLAGKPGFPL